MLHRLTEAKIKAIRDPKSTSPRLYADGGGLYLRAFGGGRSWLFRWARDGRSHDKGLGHYPDRSLTSARKEAQRLRTLLVEHGADAVLATMRRAPGAALAPFVPKPPAEVPTFDECAAQYIAGQEAGWSRDHSHQWSSSLAQYASPKIGKMSVDRIDTPEVLSVLQPIWETKNPTARRVRERIGIVLAWAKTHGHRNGGENPARWEEHLEFLLPKPGKLHRVEHFAALPIQEAPAVMRRLREIDDVAARCLEWLMLTGVRSEAARDAKWSEIDTKVGLWTVPVTRGKGKTHVVPLAPAATALLASLPRTSETVFARPDGAPIGKNTMRTILSKLVPGYTVHGLRSTFRDWCSENGHERELAELSLGHNFGDATEQSYRRTQLIERRRAVMAAWADFLEPANREPYVEGEPVPLLVINRH
jgi:integrase